MKRHISWAWHLEFIFRRGMKAFEQGKKREDNPYPWAKTGFNRQRREYWDKGFEEAMMIASDERRAKGASFANLDKPK